MATIQCTVDPFASFIDVTATFTVGTTAAIIERQDPGGPWDYIRAGAIVEVDSLTGVAVYEDHEAPMDVPVRFRATKTAPTTPAEQVISPEITLVSYGKVWLKDPAFGAYDTELHEVTGLPELTFASRAGIFPVIDREDPVVVAARRQNFTGELHFTTVTDVQRADMERLLKRGQVLLLSVPPAYGMGNAYIHVGDVTATRVGVATEPTRAWTLPITRVDRPSSLGYVPLGMHWEDVYYKYTTWQDLVDTGEDWEWVYTEDTPL